MLIWQFKFEAKANFRKMKINCSRVFHRGSPCDWHIGGQWIMTNSCKYKRFAHTHTHQNTHTRQANATQPICNIHMWKLFWHILTFFLSSIYTNYTRWFCLPLLDRHPKIHKIHPIFASTLLISAVFTWKSFPPPPIFDRKNYSLVLLTKYTKNAANNS